MPKFAPSFRFIANTREPLSPACLSPEGVRAGRRAEGQQLPFEAVAATIRDYLEEASTRKAVAQYLAILASQTTIEGVTLPIADGPLVQ